MALKTYGSWSPEVADEQRRELDAMGAGMWKPKDGKNRVRFAPPQVGVKSPLVQTQNHYIEVPGKEFGVGFNCPRVMVKPVNSKKCPSCIRVDELIRTGNKADEEAAFKLKPKLRVYAYVIDRAAPELGWQAYAFGKKVYDQLLEIRGDQEKGGDFTDPSEDGFDIEITKRGSNLKTEYAVKARDSSPLGNDEWLEQLGALPKLDDKFAQILTYDQIMEKLGDEFDFADIVGAAPKKARGGRRVEEDARDTD